MKLHGAGFASKLARAWEAADSENRKKLEAAFADIFDSYAEPEWLTIPPPCGFVDLGMGPVKVHDGDETCWIYGSRSDWTNPNSVNAGDCLIYRYAAKIGSVTAALNGKGPCQVYGYTENGIEIKPLEGWEIVPEKAPLRERDRAFHNSYGWGLKLMIEVGEPAKIDMGVRAYARRKQPETVPLEVSDWAGGPWWVRQKGSSNAYAVIEVDLHNASICVGAGLNWLFPPFLDCARSKDLINWEPCTKEAK